MDVLLFYAFVAYRENFMTINHTDCMRKFLLSKAKYKIDIVARRFSDNYGKSLEPTFLRVCVGLSILLNIEK